MANDTVRNLVERAFDREAMEEALIQEVQERIDYTDLAENAIDEYGEWVDEAISEMVENVLESFLPF